MKFMKLDTPVLTVKAAGAAGAAGAVGAAATHKHHNDTVDHSGYIYLDEMLDKTFLTDYFLH